MKLLCWIGLHSWESWSFGFLYPTDIRHCKRCGLLQAKDSGRIWGRKWISVRITTAKDEV